MSNQEIEAEIVEYRAVSLVVDWRGPVRNAPKEAWADAKARAEACAEVGGYDRCQVAMRDGDRCVSTDGSPIWPSHGRSCGAMRW